jgi:Mn2+/Fe2+ NRAMP family transporter
MATSAIGPGFITQTATFTVQLGAAFACAILLSVLIDIAVQLNVWRVVGIAGRYTQDLASAVLPGAGMVLVVLVVAGGLVFNIGNVGGAGLGLQTMTGLDPAIGGAISAVLAIAIFLVRKAQSALDRVVIVLGAVMLAMALWAAIASSPPVGEALVQAVAPDTFSFLAVTTLVGGTVGGYITYAGAHRMVDAGVSGPADVRQVTRTSVLSIVVTAVARWLLFLVVLGAVTGGVALSTGNAMADAFGAALGGVGRVVFGLILWAAALTSVIGAAYTSVSFLSSLHPWISRHRGAVTVVFIAVSTVVFVALRTTPSTLLVLAGAVNGLILPIGFAFLLWVAARRSGDLLQGYRYPRWLLVIGVLTWLLTVYLGINSLSGIANLVS